MINRVTNIILHILVAVLFLGIPVVMAGFVIQVYQDLATTYGSLWGWLGACFVGLLCGGILLIAFHNLVTMGRGEK